MGRKRTTDNSNLTIKKTVRFSEDEWLQISTRMNNSDYLSFTRFCKDILLKGRISYTKVTMTDRSIRNQINNVTSQISRIGNNYNQFVKRYQTTCKVKKKDGTPAIDTKVTIYYAKRLEAATEQLKDLQNQLIELASTLQVDERNKDTK